MQVVLLGSLKKAGMSTTLFFSAVSQRFPNVKRHNLYHHVQQFEMKEIPTLEPYFDCFLQNISVASKHSGEEKKKTPQVK